MLNCKRLCSPNSSNEAEVLVQWKGLLDFKATWEPAHNALERFPDLYLEDNVDSLAGSKGERLLLAYKRKKKGVGPIHDYLIIADFNRENMDSPRQSELAPTYK